MEQADYSYQVVTDVDEAQILTLSSVVRAGARRQTSNNTKSVGKGQGFTDLANFGFVIMNPRARLFWNPGWNSWNPRFSYRLTVAVARFLWMMAGSDRAMDIGVYEPGIKRFADDGIRVPGSNYGQRIIQPAPGINQLKGAIERLREDPATRRAAIAIYQPEDAVRSSSDIPCAFGVMFRIEGGKLHTTSIMRSQNAFGLMPFNLFEFSMLAEIVATEVGIPLGTLTNIAHSMHVYDRNIDEASSIIGKHDQSLIRLSMPAMPSDVSPLDQIARLNELEHDLRHSISGMTNDGFQDWLYRVSDHLKPYWQQFILVIALHLAQKNGSGIDFSMIQSLLTSPFYDYVPDGIFEVAHKRNSKSQMTLPGMADVAKLNTLVDMLPDGYLDITEHFEAVLDECDEALVSSDQPKISRSEATKLRQLFLVGERIAARDNLDHKQVLDILAELRSLR